MANPSLRHKLVRLIPYAREQKRTLLRIVLMSMAISAMTVLQPWPLKLLIDHALGGAPIPAWLRGLLVGASELTPAVLVVCAGALSLLVFAITSALEIGLSWYWTLAGQRMVYDLARHLFARLQRVSLLFHSRRSIGDSLDRLSADTWCIYVFAEGVVVAPLQQSLTLAGITLAAWSLDYRLTILSLGMSPALVVVARWFGGRLQRRARVGREAQSRLASFVHQTLTSISVVQIFGAEHRNEAHFQRLANDAAVKSQQGVLLGSYYLFASGITNAVGSAIVVFYASHRVLAGSLSIGSLLVFVAYLRSMQQCSDTLLKTYSKLKSAEASIDRVLEVLDTEEAVEEAKNAKPVPTVSPSQRGSVELENITFGYDPGRAVLKNVSLKARPGEHIAIVGTTGAGKSTLVSLLPRLFDPWEGRVLFHGVDVRELNIAALRSQISLVLQEPFLLPLSVAENIAYGDSRATFEQVVAAAVAANADDFIRRLPRGYETVLGERGATLSGGERQRLALARALVRDAAVVILDEPTSALDNQTELLFLEALERLTKNRTTFTIAHRLSTVRAADRIIVLDQGEIAEEGTHEELLAAAGAYYRLHSLQFAVLSEGVTS